MWMVLLLLSVDSVNDSSGICSVSIVVLSVNVMISVCSRFRWILVVLLVLCVCVMRLVVFICRKLKF